MSSPLDFLRVPRRLALWLISFVVAMTTAVSFAESYRALYIWATHHQVTGNFAYIWPLMIDSFIVIGEATLFVAMLDRWLGRARVFPWTVTLGGLLTSVAGNVGHVHTHGTIVAVVATRATAAVAPLAASASLAVGLGVLKRVVRLHHSTADAPVQTIGIQSAPSGPDRPLEALTAIGRPSAPAFAPSEPVSQPLSAAPQPAGYNGSSNGAPRQARTWSRDRRVQSVLKNNPDITGADLGRRIGVSPRHGQRILKSMGGI